MLSRRSKGRNWRWYTLRWRSRGNGHCGNGGVRYCCGDFVGVSALLAAGVESRHGEVIGARREAGHCMRREGDQRGGGCICPACCSVVHLISGQVGLGICVPRKPDVSAKHERTGQEAKKCKESDAVDSPLLDSHDRVTPQDPFVCGIHRPNAGKGLVRINTRPFSASVWIGREWDLLGESVTEPSNSSFGGLSGRGRAPKNADTTRWPVGVWSYCLHSCLKQAVIASRGGTWNSCISN